MSWEWTPDNLNALSRFLRERGVCDEVISTRRIGDGHSNLTYLVSDGTRSVVLRRPPPPPTPPGAHDMLRESRFIRSLDDAEVPVAKLLATAEAGEVLDVSFYVMSFVEGPIVTTKTPSPLDNPKARRRVGEAMIDTLAELHAVDWRAAGLADLGKPEGFNERHLRRMGRLVADEDGSPPPHFEMIYSWLGRHVPAESGDAIVHNDYRIGNVVLAPDTSGCIAAVLDWELATIGDPLFDVGYFLASVPEPGTPMTPTEQLSTAMCEDGYPSREELANRYEQRTGRDLVKLDWYTVLALWKLAVLYEYGRRRAVRGVGDPYYADQTLVQSFLEGAHRMAGLEPPPKPPTDEIAQES